MSSAKTSHATSSFESARREPLKLDLALQSKVRHYAALAAYCVDIGATLLLAGLVGLKDGLQVIVESGQEGVEVSPLEKELKAHASSTRAQAHRDTGIAKASSYRSGLDASSSEATGRPLQAVCQCEDIEAKKNTRDTVPVSVGTAELEVVRQIDLHASDTLPARSATGGGTDSHHIPSHTSESVTTSAGKTDGTATSTSGKIGNKKNSSNRFYCISVGRKVGVYPGPWPDIATYVKHVPGAEYTSHKHEEAALNAFIRAAKKGQVRVVGATELQSIDSSVFASSDDE